MPVRVGSDGKVTLIVNPQAKKKKKKLEVSPAPPTRKTPGFVNANPPQRRTPGQGVAALHADEPETPHAAGAVTSLKPLYGLGDTLSWSELQYLQRLAWTTKDKDTDPQLGSAIDMARGFIDDLKQNDPHFQGVGLSYKAFHEQGKTQNAKWYDAALEYEHAQALLAGARTGRLDRYRGEGATEEGPEPYLGAAPTYSHQELVSALKSLYGSKAPEFIKGKIVQVRSKKDIGGGTPGLEVVFDVDGKQSAIAVPFSSLPDKPANVAPEAGTPEAPSVPGYENDLRLSTFSKAWNTVFNDTGVKQLPVALAAYLLSTDAPQLKTERQMVNMFKALKDPFVVHPENPYRVDDPLAFFAFEADLQASLKPGTATHEAILDREPGGWKGILTTEEGSRYRGNLLGKLTDDDSIRLDGVISDLPMSIGLAGLGVNLDKMVMRVNVADQRSFNRHPGGPVINTLTILQQWLADSTRDPVTGEAKFKVGDPWNSDMDAALQQKVWVAAVVRAAADPKDVEAAAYLSEHGNTDINQVLNSALPPLEYPTPELLERLKASGGQQAVDEYLRQAQLDPEQRKAELLTGLAQEAALPHEGKYAAVFRLWQDNPKFVTPEFTGIFKEAQSNLNTSLAELFSSDPSKHDITSRFALHGASDAVRIKQAQFSKQTVDTLLYAALALAERNMNQPKGPGLLGEALGWVGPGVVAKAAGALGFKEVEKGYEEGNAEVMGAAGKALTFAHQPWTTAMETQKVEVGRHIEAREGRQALEDLHAGNPSTSRSKGGGAKVDNLASKQFQGWKKSNPDDVKIYALHWAEYLATQRVAHPEMEDKEFADQWMMYGQVWDTLRERAGGGYMTMGAYQMQEHDSTYQPGDNLLAEFLIDTAFEAFIYAPVVAAWELGKPALQASKAYQGVRASMYTKMGIETSGQVFARTIEPGIFIRKFKIKDFQTARLLADADTPAKVAKVLEDSGADMMQFDPGRWGAPDAFRLRAATGDSSRPWQDALFRIVGRTSEDGEFFADVRGLETAHEATLAATGSKSLSNDAANVLADVGAGVHDGAQQIDDLLVKAGVVEAAEDAVGLIAERASARLTRNQIRQRMNAITKTISDNFAPGANKLTKKSLEDLKKEGRELKTKMRESLIENRRPMPVARPLTDVEKKYGRRLYTETEEANMRHNLFATWNDLQEVLHQIRFATPATDEGRIARFRLRDHDGYILELERTATAETPGFISDGRLYDWWANEVRPQTSTERYVGRSRKAVGRLFGYDVRQGLKSAEELSVTTTAQGAYMDIVRPNVADRFLLKETDEELQVLRESVQELQISRTSARNAVYPQRVIALYNRRVTDLVANGGMVTADAEKLVRTQLLQDVIAATGDNPAVLRGLSGAELRARVEDALNMSGETAAAKRAARAPVAPAGPSSEAFMQDLGTEMTRIDSGDLEDVFKFQHTTADGHTATVSLMRVPGEPGIVDFTKVEAAVARTGAGTELDKKLFEFADKHGITLRAEVDPGAQPATMLENGKIVPNTRAGQKLDVETSAAASIKRGWVEKSRYTDGTGWTHIILERKPKAPVVKAVETVPVPEWAQEWVRIADATDWDGLGAKIFGSPALSAPVLDQRFSGLVSTLSDAERDLNLLEGAISEADQLRISTEGLIRARELSPVTGPESAYDRTMGLGGDGQKAGADKSAEYLAKTGEAQPLLPAQRQMYGHSKVDVRLLMTWRSGKVARDLEEFNTHQLFGASWLTADKATSLFKTLILARVATAIRIVLGDEATRFLPEGINPMQARHHFKELLEYERTTGKEIIPPNLRTSLKRLYGSIGRTNYAVVSPEDFEFLPAYNAALRQMNADPLVRQWRKNYSESRARALADRLGEKDSMDAALAETKVWLTQEAYTEGTIAADHLSLTNRLWAGETKFKDAYSSYDSAAQLEAMRTAFETQNVEEWADLVNSNLQFYAENRYTKRSFADGSEAVSKDFRGVKNAPAKATVDIDFTEVMPTVIGRVGAGLDTGRWWSPQSLFGNTMEGISGWITEATYGHYYVLERTRLLAQAAERLGVKGLDPADIFGATKVMDETLGRETARQIMEDIERRAYTEGQRQVTRIMYTSGTAAAEDVLRNIVLFLPAQRQYLAYWATALVKHPWLALYFNRLNNAPDYWTVDIPFTGGTDMQAKIYMRGLLFATPGFQNDSTAKKLYSMVPGMGLPGILVGTLVNAAEMAGWAEPKKYAEKLPGGNYYNDMYRPLNASLSAASYALGTMIVGEPTQFLPEQLAGTNADRLYNYSYLLKGILSKALKRGGFDAVGESSGSVFRGLPWVDGKVGYAASVEGLKALIEAGWNYIVPGKMTIVDKDAQAFKDAEIKWMGLTTFEQRLQMIKDEDGTIWGKKMHFEGISDEVEKKAYLYQNSEITPYVVGSFKTVRPQGEKYDFDTLIQNTKDDFISTSTGSEVLALGKKIDSERKWFEETYLPAMKQGEKWTGNNVAGMPESLAGESTPISMSNLMRIKANFEQGAGVWEQGKITDPKTGITHYGIGTRGNMGLENVGLAAELDDLGGALSLSSSSFAASTDSKFYQATEQLFQLRAGAKFVRTSKFYPEFTELYRNSRLDKEMAINTFAAITPLGRMSDEEARVLLGSQYNTNVGWVLQRTASVIDQYDDAESKWQDKQRALSKAGKKSDDLKHFRYTDFGQKWYTAMTKEIYRCWVGPQAPAGVQGGIAGQMLRTGLAKPHFVVYTPSAQDKLPESQQAGSRALTPQDQMLDSAVDLTSYVPGVRNPAPPPEKGRGGATYAPTGPQQIPSSVPETDPSGKRKINLAGQALPERLLPGIFAAAALGMQSSHNPRLISYSWSKHDMKIMESEAKYLKTYLKTADPITKYNIREGTRSYVWWMLLTKMGDLQQAAWGYHSDYQQDNAGYFGRTPTEKVSVSIVRQVKRKWLPALFKVSPEFKAEWEYYDKKAGGNLIWDFINTFK